jgi:hypothetical protein
MTNNIKKFPSKKPVETLPESCANTESYLLNNVLFGGGPTKTVTDFVTGDQRNRRWGMSVAMGIIPGFDQVPVDGPIILPNVPSRFFAADSLDELRARLIHEIDKAINMAKLSVEKPEEFVKQHMEMTQQAVQTEVDDMN